MFSGISNGYKSSKNGPKFKKGKVNNHDSRRFNNENRASDYDRSSRKNGGES